MIEELKNKQQLDRFLVLDGWEIVNQEEFI